MKRYFFNLLLILGSVLTLGLSAANAGTAYIGPFHIVQLDTIGVTFLGETAGNVEIKIPTGFLPASLTCTDPQYLTAKAADVSQAEYAALAMARAQGGEIYLWVSDDSAHTAFTGRCSFYAVTY